MVFYNFVQISISFINFLIPTVMKEMGIKITFYGINKNVYIDCRVSVMSLSLYVYTIPHPPGK